MLKNKKIAVVVPAYNEQKLILKVLSTMPSFVDSIIVVDDASRDKTKEVVEKYRRKDSRVRLIKHEKNRGVGSSRVTGLNASLKENNDITVMMDGDAQMDPEELINLVKPIVELKADYVKGNRFFTGEAWGRIPKVRYIGNAFLSLLTKIASGYWHIADSQCGYAAVSKKVLNLIDLSDIYPGYGSPNDFLVKLNVASAKVIDIPVTPIYGIGEKSGIKIWKVVPTISLLIFKLFLWRIREKYIIRDFHPLVFFYFFGTILLFLGATLGIYYTYLKVAQNIAFPSATAVLISLFIISGLQSVFFAMWFDMEYNKDLKASSN